MGFSPTNGGKTVTSGAAIDAAWNSWGAYLAEVATKTGASEDQLAWLIRESAERENLQWERLDEIRRLGT